jgi:hydroxylamine reductase (hybrid-cluster protein)
MNAVFSTMTNVNFTDVRSYEHIQEGIAICKDLQAKLGTSPPTTLYHELDGLSLEELEAKGLEKFSIPIRQTAMGNDDAFCLNELATYALKGVCAYLCHSHQLGMVTDDIMMGVHQVHAMLNSNEPDTEGLLAACLKVGELNTQTLALLDEGHATKYGVPEPTQVRTTAVEGNCILISGHDMVDLHALLEQTEGTGVNVYTHGESRRLREKDIARKVTKFHHPFFVFSLILQAKCSRAIPIQGSKNSSTLLETMEPLGRIKSSNLPDFQGPLSSPPTVFWNQGKCTRIVSTL